MAAERISMLPFGGDVLAFQSKSLTSKSRDQRKGSEVSLIRLTFGRDSQSFSAGDGSAQPVLRDSSAEADVVLSGCALDVRLRQKVPCVLLRLSRRRTSAFRYLLCSAEGRLYAEVALPYEMSGHVSILKGPTLVWSHESAVFYTSSQSGGVKEVPIPMTVRFIGELPLGMKRKPVILGSQSSPDGKSVLYFIDEDECCDSACLLPDAYSSVTQCMMVLWAEQVSGSFRSAVLAATSMRQLVRFEDGFPRDVCPLPYERPLSIRTVHTLKNDCLIAITFSQGNVCAVWRDTFQVASCWTGVRLLLVDDFLCCGTEQMLLVFEDQSSTGEMISSFLLTDLCGVSFSCGRADGAVLSTSDSAQENLLLTVRALESRLQSGLDVLEDLQRDSAVTDRLTLQSLEALRDRLSGREHAITPPEQEGLVSLWDEDDEAGEEERAVSDDGMLTECAEALLKVDGVWQRVVGQSLIIGVVLRPTDNTSVMNISASVVLDSRLTGVVPVMSAQILRFPASDAAVALGPSAAKISRSDRSGSRLALVAVTEAAPLLTSGGLRCPIMLHYSTRASSGPSRVSLYAGQISVDIREVSAGKFRPRLLQDHTLNTDEAREDLLSLVAVLGVWSFLVQCWDHTLVDVLGWLKVTQGVERLDVDPSFSADLSDLSDLRLFRWEQRSPFQAVLSIHCRDGLSLLRLLHSLCDFLPASHQVRLLGPPGAGGAAPALARALETEMLGLLQEVSSTLQSGQGETRGPDEADETSSEPMQRLRGAWQRERGRYHERLRPLLDGPAYSGLVERMIDRQLDADEALMGTARL